MSRIEKPLSKWVAEQKSLRSSGWQGYSLYPDAMHPTSRKCSEVYEIV